MSLFIVRDGEDTLSVRVHSCKVFLLHSGDSLSFCWIIVRKKISRKRLFCCAIKSLIWIWKCFENDIMVGRAGRSTAFSGAGVALHHLSCLVDSAQHSTVHLGGIKPPSVVHATESGNAVLLLFPLGGGSDQWREARQALHCGGRRARLSNHRRPWIVTVFLCVCKQTGGAQWSPATYGWCERHSNPTRSSAPGLKWFRKDVEVVFHIRRGVLGRIYRAAMDHIKAKPRWLRLMMENDVWQELSCWLPDLIHVIYIPFMAYRLPRDLTYSTYKSQRGEKYVARPDWGVTRTRSPSTRSLFLLSAYVHTCACNHSCHLCIVTSGIGLWQEIHTVYRWVLLRLTGEKIERRQR